MIVGDGVDDAELGEVVLVRCVVAVPGHHVEWRVVLGGHEQVALVLAHHLRVSRHSQEDILDCRIYMSALA